MVNEMKMLGDKNDNISTPTYVPNNSNQQIPTQQSTSQKQVPEDIPVIDINEDEIPF